MTQTHFIPQQKYQASDFREYLKAELIRRTKANPAYSLRAFARALGVQSGFLSKILLGQRRVTEATVRRFGMKLGLSLQEIERYEKRASISSTSQSNAFTFQQISYDQFQAMAEWYHFAILELSTIQNFTPHPKWIARALGISIAEARSAIERLERLGYINIAKDGSWSLREEHSTTLGMAETSAALKQMQKQILQKALEALDLINVAERDQSGMTMSIDSSLLPQAKERIKQFRRDLATLLESGKKKDAVYQLSVSLYPLTSKEKI